MNHNHDILPVQRCLEGDTQAFAEIIDRYKNRIFSFTCRILQNTEDAREITQETFIKAFRSLNSYNPQYPFISWLFRIAHNSCIDYLRARAPHTLSIDDETSPIELEDFSCDCEEYVEFRLRQEEIEKLLASLAPLYREAILLQYKEDLTCREIAEVLQIPEGTAKIRLFRAKAILRKKLKP